MESPVIVGTLLTSCPKKIRGFLIWKRHTYKCKSGFYDKVKVVYVNTYFELLGNVEVTNAIMFIPNHQVTILGR